MTKYLTLVGSLSLILSCNVQAGETELLNAISGLREHVVGSANLTAAQITTRRTILRNNASFAGNSAASISASLDLLRVYENRNDPIFRDEFSRTNASTQFFALRLAMFDLQQAIMDDVYNASNLANHRDLLADVKFEMAGNDVNRVNAPADPNAVYQVQINASQPRAFGYEVQFGTEPARRPTGAYLAPGSIGTVTVPPNLVGKGFQIRVGAHVANLQNRPNNYKRLNRVTRTYPINSVTTEIANPLGGGIYIEVPYQMEEGLATIQFRNTVRSPFYSNTVARTTTLPEWRNTERNFSGPWADFETDKFMLTLPTDWIFAYSDPVTLMNNWDLSMDACSDLQGLPRVRPKTVLYCIIDVTLDANVFSPGYPQSNDNFDSTPANPYNGNQNHDYLKGPQFTDEVDFHEFGHAASINKFSGEVEALVNLFAVPVLNKMFNVPLETAFGRSLNFDMAGRMNRTAAAINWSIHPRFRSNQPMRGSEMQYQHRGYAKYVETAALFGWDALEEFWSSVAFDAELDPPVFYEKNADPINSRFIRMSNAANADLLPLIYFWGIHPNSPTENTAESIAIIQEKLAVQGIKPSAAIYDRLKYYQSVVPMSRGAFRAHDDAFRSFVSNADKDLYAGFRNTWDADLGQDSVDRIQNIINLFFPDGRPVESLPYYEDFEDGIGAFAQATDDDYEWRHNRGPTLTTNVGPDAAAGGEFYMYAEGHDAPSIGDTTSLTATFDFSEVQPTVLTFDYHMYGAFIDFMTVDIFDGQTWTHDIWRLDGQQQTSSSDAWRSATVDLTSFTGNSEVTVRFRTQNETFKGGDPAIDNVRIDVPLQTPPFADSFENGLDVLWRKSTGADSFFIVNSGGTDTGASGPSGASDGNNYIYAEGHNGIVGFKTAGFEREFDFSNSSDAVLSFDYHMYGGQINFLTVDINDGTRWIEDVWRRNGQQQNSSAAPWANATVDLSAYSNLPRVTIRFRTGQRRYGASDVAIDNFALTATTGPAPPVADDLAVSGNQGNGFAINLSASDPSDSPLTYTVFDSPSNGTLSGNAPALTYTPNAGFVGTDSFTYVASNSSFTSDPATVSIVVSPPGFIFFTDFGNAADGNVNAADLNAVSSLGGSWNVDFGSIGSEFVGNASGRDYALLLDSVSATGSANGDHATLQLDSPADFSNPITVSFDFTKARSGTPKKMAITGYGPDGTSIAFQLQLDFAGAGFIEALTDAGLQSFASVSPPFASPDNAYDPSLLRNFSITLDGTSVSYEGEGLATLVGTIPNSQTALSSIEWEITGATTAAQGFWLDNVSVGFEPEEDPFVTWASGFGLTGAAADHLADNENGGLGDGYSNILEYALGLDPTVSDSAFDDIVVEADSFSVDFRRRKLDDVTIFLEWSPNLQDPWVTNGVVETVTGDDGVFEDITATVPMDQQRKFVRIRAVE